jgi:hypothetical protein
MTPKGAASGRKLSVGGGDSATSEVPSLVKT